jgi:hypothetical protein
MRIVDLKTLADFEQRSYFRRESSDAERGSETA